VLQFLKGLEKDPAMYQSVPFWSWNDKLNKDTLVEQIDWMKDNGIGGFFMHARGGLRTPYLSEEWMQCADACVQAAKERGMEAWMYDENGWPSGFAGGKLLEDEANRDAHITYTIGHYDALAWVNYSTAGEKLQRVEQPTEGECLNLYLHISPSTADILNGDVVDRFLEETHEKYAQRYGAELSNCVAGFFTDEPQYYRWGAAYTRVMPEEFRKRYGEDVLDGLGLLFVEKEGYREFRYRYWLTMHMLMLENFGKKIYNWCEDHGVAFTGHYVEENSLTGQMSCCAGIMPFYKYMHMPGIDWLNRWVGNKLSLKQLSSAAQQYGKKQTLSESYGCCGWDVTPAELKKIGDFQYVGGVNRTCHHLIPYAEHGQRKRDYPSHFSGINPWIREYFKDFNDYFTRLGYLLANSEELVHIAMLHPMRSAYFDYKDLNVKPGNGLQLLEIAFYDQLDQLAADQIPYHMLDETLLEEDGFVKDDKIGCGLCQYDCLIIPTCYTMGAHTEKLIRQYVENGGKVLLLGEKPTYLEGKPYDYPYLNSNITYDELKQTLPCRLAEPMDGVHATLRQSEVGTFLFVQNYSQESKTLHYSLKDGYTSFRRWDLTDLSYKVVSTEVALKPSESCILVFSREEVPETVSKQILHLPVDATVSEVTENYLPLDMVRYSKDGVTYSEELPYTGVFQLLLQQRYEGDIYIKHTFSVTAKPPRMWVITEDSDGPALLVNGHSVQPDLPWERQHESRKADITELICLGENEIVRKLRFYQGENVYYALFGEGVTETLLNCLSYDTEIEPLYLAGDFGVSVGELTPGQRQGILLGSGFTIGEQRKTVQNLITDGYPFFAGTIHLQRKIVLEETDVILEFQDRFHAIRVWVNGQLAGTMLYDNRIDISKFTRLGENDITLELTVSNRNLFGPHHNAEYEEPESVGPYTFELPGTWKDGKSDQYRDSYAFVPVPIR
jgi:hypothetical protein